MEILSNKEIFISFISELEMLSFPDLSPESEKIIRDFISKCTIINLSGERKKSTILLKRRYGLKLPDSIIAASASVLNLPILTADQQCLVTLAEETYYDNLSYLHENWPLSIISSFIIEVEETMNLLKHSPEIFNWWDTDKKYKIGYINK